MNTRILVTGGAGFIGSHYVRTVLGVYGLAVPGVSVTVLDALTYAGNIGNLDGVRRHPNFMFVHGDICDTELTIALTAEHDQVVHFAAESHVDRSINGSSRFARTNMMGTHTLINAAHLTGIQKFVHISTDEVYGSIREGSYPENAPLAPSSPYSASKASSDLIALSYHHTHGLDVRVTRCSNNYGHHQFPEKLIPLFITSLLDGDKVSLYGNGNNIRNWLHIDDHVQAIELVRTLGQPGEIYNIGGDTELSNKDLTALILEACAGGWESVKYVTDRKGHDYRYSANFAKIRTELGYKPHKDFCAGLEETVQWYRDNRSWWEPLKKQVMR